MDTYQSGPLDNTLIGDYLEVLIINATNNPIYKKTISGSVVELDSHPNGSLESGIHIFIRSTSGPRYEHSITFGGISDKEISTVKYFIPEVELNKGSYYHEETQLLFVHKTLGQDIPHPLQQLSYKDMVAEFESTYVANKENSTLTFYVNDPSGDIDYIYIDIGGHKSKLQATHIRSSEQDGAVLTLVMNTGGVLTTQSEVSLEELKNNTTFTSCTIFDSTIVVATSMTNLMEGIHAVTAKKKRDEDELINDRVNNRINETIEELRCTIVSMKGENKKLKAVIAERDSDIRTLKSELSRAKSECETLAAAITAIRETEKSKTEQETNKLKKEEQRHKTTRAKMSTFSEVVKVLTPIITATVGLIVGVIISRSGGDNDDLFNVI